ncbi:RICIN domain-containing protein [Micromonospora krabiensis]|uniref:Ricin-type beta-trefoil lectin domain-containing protein n=1 Tax=Micromonospora krabiensis TaxID=307121 RepID=A0A1C3N5A6_9ACTN|nr:RICIN domain-containing protein [Micromonospora krabiensis]SBV27755.1 Ricin-type beta-trefoil lectin domain-containing protein [Micromonospora krabiensis]
MSDPADRPDPPGTVYGSPRPARPGPPRDPLMRVALAVGLVGVLLGVLFATGVFRDDDGPTKPAAVDTPATGPVTSPAAGGPTPTATTGSPSPSASAPSPTPTAPAQPGGPTVLRAVTSGLCLALDGDGEKAEAELAACSGGPEQQWVVSPVTADVVTLTNAAYGQCLDVEGGSPDDGARLQQFPCHGQPNQQWRLAPTGTGPLLLVAVHSGKCGQADDDGAEAGDSVRQQLCDGAVRQQQWTLG